MHLREILGGILSPNTQCCPLTTALDKESVKTRIRTSASRQMGESICLASASGGFQGPTTLIQLPQ